jgi:hypothetical protein
MVITRDWCTTRHPGQSPVWAWYFGSTVLALRLGTLAFPVRKPLRYSFTTSRNLQTIIFVRKTVLIALSSGEGFVYQKAGI